MRTLAFAYKIVDNDATDCQQLIKEKGFTFVGMVAIADPIREGINQAIGECRSAGINIKIVTGDTIGTATEIARQIGLWNDKEDAEINRITGPEFASLDDEKALERVGKLKIMHFDWQIGDIRNTFGNPLALIISTHPLPLWVKYNRHQQINSIKEI